MHVPLSAAAAIYPTITNKNKHLDGDFNFITVVHFKNL